MCYHTIIKQDVNGERCYAMEQKTKNSLKGILLVAFGACCWGVSGNVGQFLKTTRGFSMEWLVSCRLLVGGFLLLCYLAAKYKKKVFAIWQQKECRTALPIFAIFGMLPAQFTYFVAIKYSNAATATVLQYTGPVLIVLYMAFKQKKLPSKLECVAVICALFGTFLLATHGNIHSLALSPQALFWGILSAFALASYTIQPRKMLENWDSAFIIGWGMFLAGIVLSPFYPITNFSGTLDSTAMIALVFILSFGTIFAFCCYLSGVAVVGATKGSLIACLEPLSAAVVSIVWLKERFTYIDLIGFAFIITTIGMLSLPKKTCE